MATISLEAQITTRQLLEAILQLEKDDFEQIRRQIVQMDAKRTAQTHYQREAELQNVIFQKKSPAFRRRFDRLNAKRRANTLTPAEHTELLKLIDAVQAADVQYIEALSELARLRKVALPELMEQLGLKGE